MSYKLTVGSVGQVGVLPRRNQMVSTNSLSEIIAAGYIDQYAIKPLSVKPTDIFDVTYSYDEASQTGTYGQFTCSISTAGVVTLAQDAGGLSPSNPAKQYVASVGSAVISGYLAKFVDTVGTIDDTAGTAINAGSIQAGLSGTAGTLYGFASTATTGKFGLLPVANSGDYTVSISNAAHGQATVYSMADIGASTGGLPVATAAIKIKSVAGASAAGGAAAQSFTDAFCTTGSNVVGCWNTQTNAASVLKIVPGNGSFVVTSSADAGSGTFNYTIIK